MDRGDRQERAELQRRHGVGAELERVAPQPMLKAVRRGDSEASPARPSLATRVRSPEKQPAKEAEPFREGAEALQPVGGQDRWRGTVQRHQA